MHKILIISPFYPWKGGISHHTACLANELILKGVDVHVISFSRQYPKFLYPGKTQREVGENQFPDVPVFYLIDTLNPFTWWKTYKFIKKNNYTTCIFKYWHFYFAPLYIFLSFLLVKSKIRIICIVDNLFGHEKSVLDFIFLKLFFFFPDCFVTQSDFVNQQFQNLFPSKKNFLIKHPAYEHFGDKINKNEARSILNIPNNKIVLLFFGFIRPYKGLDQLLLLFPQLIKRIPNLYLVIAGECFGDFQPYQKIIKENCLDEYISGHYSYTPSNKIPIFFSASDFFIMPYRTATNSGVMEIAKFYELPIIISFIEAFKSFSREEGIFPSDFLDVDKLASIIKINIGKKSLHRSNSWADFSEELIKLL